MKLIIAQGEVKFLTIYGCREHGGRVWHLTSQRPQDSSKNSSKGNPATMAIGARRRKIARRMLIEAWENEGGSFRE